MPTTMQQKRGIASRWESINPILLAGEIGFETDTNKIKIGDGSTPWNDLSYVKPDSVEIAFTHQQNAQSNLWNFTHTLSFVPNVLVTDSNGNALECDVKYIGSNEIEIRLSEAYTGYAYLS